ncbi:PucR family transcriptional regulator [Marmoricola sp. RAF53]|uniref:PucR family transcriptional regulator n=1 Tax=Marmoricola sp. RAF53 TaxID=3233059 RepID=UPI003F9ABBD6
MVTMPQARREELVAARVAATALDMAENLDLLTSTLYEVLSETITELRGDQLILDLLRTSVESNLGTLVHAVRMGIPMDDVPAPPPAVEYARRLSQRGISSNALLRAYRLGQEGALGWILDRISTTEPDPYVAFAAGQQFMSLTFRYIDAVAEQLIDVYEAERERWLANRSTVRTATLTDLLASRPVDLGAAEKALGYRLRQPHLGVVLWRADVPVASDDLHDLEQLLATVARTVQPFAQTSGQPLFVQRDLATAWGWIPLAREPGPGYELPTTALVTALAALPELGCGRLLLALGVPANGPDGFRRTHLDAVRAQEVAIAGSDSDHRVFSYTDAGVRAAALLAADLPATRRLVSEALGGLALDTPAAARLRDTLKVFLQTRNSFAATGQQVHLHKNTVKYRVDKAVAARGRSLDEDRLDLELALTACHWLGSTVLSRP